MRPPDVSNVEAVVKLHSSEAMKQTMAALSSRCADPSDSLNQVTVVDDQLGRLTFTDQMAEGIFHLLDACAPYGTYDLTGSGAIRSWQEIAARVFDLVNGNADKVFPVSTEKYYATAQGPIAPRPHFSALSLEKIEVAGFTPRDWEEELTEYVRTKLD